MATVKNNAEARAYFGLPANHPIIEIEATLPANWHENFALHPVDAMQVNYHGERIVHLSKQAC